MKKSTKIWLIIATSFMLIGCIVFTGVMTMLNWDFSKLSTTNFETNHCDVHQAFQNISIVTQSADIEFLPADNNKVSVVCCQPDHMKHEVLVKDNTLHIQVNDQRKWYEYIGFNFSTTKISVYLPQGQYGTLTVTSTTGDLKIPNGFGFENMDISQVTGDINNCASVDKGMSIRVTTGDIVLENIQAQTMDFSVTTGDIVVCDSTCTGESEFKVRTGDVRLTNVSCNGFSSSGTTGDLLLTNTIVKDVLNVGRTTGEIKLDRCDAGELYLKTTTGSVTGTLLSEKVFIAKSTTGSVDVPKTTNGGICEISTTTGNIQMDIVS